MRSHPCFSTANGSHATAVHYRELQAMREWVTAIAAQTSTIKNAERKSFRSVSFIPFPYGLIEICFTAASACPGISGSCRAGMSFVCSERI